MPVGLRYPTLGSAGAWWAQAVPGEEGQKVLLEWPFSSAFCEPHFCLTMVLILGPAPQKDFCMLRVFFFVPEYLSSEASGSFLIKMLNIFGSGTSVEEELHFRYK